MGQVRTPAGIDYEVNWTWFGADQFAPPVGSVCDFTFHYEAWRRVETARLTFDYSRPALVVTGYACDRGRDPLIGPPDPQPSAGLAQPWELGTLRPVVALSSLLLPTLEELPATREPGLPEGLRFRVYRAVQPGSPQTCPSDGPCGGKFLYILVWREGRPDSVLLQTSVATDWREVRIEGAGLAGDQLTLRASAEGSWPSGTRRLPLRAEISLP